MRLNLSHTRLTPKLKAGLVFHKRVNTRVHPIHAPIYLSHIRRRHSVRALLVLIPTHLVCGTARAILALLACRAFSGGGIWLQTLHSAQVATALGTRDLGKTQLREQQTKSQWQTAHETIKNI